MNGYVSGHELGRGIIEALGLDERVVALDIRCRLGEPASITITRFVSGEEGVAIINEIRRYRLTEIEVCEEEHESP